jgi:HSP20 family protein
MLRREIQEHSRGFSRPLVDSFPGNSYLFGQESTDTKEEKDMARDVIKWEPFREVSRLRRDMDRLWEDFFGPTTRAPRPWGEEWSPAVDVAETPEKVTVKAEIPGIDPHNINISLVGDLLTIKGEKKSEREETKENYHLVERSYGSFSRALRLPAAVDADQIEARYENGVLSVTCPKKEPVKPKAISIKTT